MSCEQDFLSAKGVFGNYVPPQRREGEACALLVRLLETEEATVEEVEA